MYIQYTLPLCTCKNDAALFYSFILHFLHFSTSLKKNIVIATIVVLLFFLYIAAALSVRKLETKISVTLIVLCTCTQEVIIKTTFKAIRLQMHNRKYVVPRCELVNRLLLTSKGIILKWF